jgi:hypothetical protein
MPLAPALVPHLVEVLEQTPAALVAVGPVSAEGWGLLRTSIEAKGAEWYSWPAPGPPGRVCFVTDFMFAKCSPSRHPGLLLAALAESEGPDALDCSAGWRASARRMAALLGEVA